MSATDRILLVLDQASFHTARKLKVPEGLHLLFRPPKSLELQPAERLWPLTNEAIASRSFEPLDELETLTAYRCRILMHRRDFVRGVTGYYWWLGDVSLYGHLSGFDIKTSLQQFRFFAGVHTKRRHSPQRS